MWTLGASALSEKADRQMTFEICDYRLMELNGSYFVYPPARFQASGAEAGMFNTFETAASWIIARELAYTNRSRGDYIRLIENALLALFQHHTEGLSKEVLNSRF